VIVVSKSPQLYGFFGLVFIQKTGLTLAFFLSSSNRNRGKSFAVLSKKKSLVVSLFSKTFLAGVGGGCFVWM
jgi:hypothetical protein